MGRRFTGVLVLAALLTGCGSGHGHPKRHRADPSVKPSGGASGMRFTESQLSDALLYNFQQWAPIAEPQTGQWSSLPGVPDAGGVQDAPPGVVFKPAKCKPAIWAGPDPARLGRSPAAMVSLRKPGDTSPGGLQAWDELIDLGSQPRQAVLGTGPMTGCGTVSADYQGRNLSFKENPTPPALGSGSRGAVLGISVSGSRRTWVVAFMGNGYAGTVFVQGPVTAAQVNAFASAVYQNARQKLG